MVSCPTAPTGYTLVTNTGSSTKDCVYFQTSVYTAESQITSSPILQCPYSLTTSQNTTFTISASAGYASTDVKGVWSPDSTANYSTLSPSCNLNGSLNICKYTQNS